MPRRGGVLLRSRDGRPPRLFLIYAAAHTLLGALALAATWRHQGPATDAAALLIAAAVVLSELGAVDLPAGGSASLSYPLLVAATLLYGPPTGAVVAVLSAVDVRSLGATLRRGATGQAGNIGQISTSYAVASWAYVSTGGFVAGTASKSAFATASVGGILGHLALFSALFMTMNVGFTLVGIALHRRVPLAAVWHASISWTLATHVALGFVGLAIAMIVAAEPLGFLLFVFPLAVARQLYQRYIGLKDAYLDTVRSLVAAIEAKDPYTRGHSERVAIHAVALGRAAGIPDRQLERLEFAALLHDLGKIGIRSSILGKPAQLDPWEVREIRHHPEIGARILERVPYLSDIVPGVLAHHERFDGGGYSIGLRGDNVPLEARILAVADSYDAMTTERPYRAALDSSAATAELRLGAGGQFDSRLVGCFLPLVGDHEPFHPPVGERTGMGAVMADNDA